MTQSSSPSNEKPEWVQRLLKRQEELKAKGWDPNDWSPPVPKRGHIGFTGTQYGCSEAQLDALYRMMTRLDAAVWHHGDCVGADAQSHQLALAKGLKVVVHPPNNNTKRAWCKGGHEVRDPKKYLQRNADIVRETVALVACPMHMYDPHKTRYHLGTTRGGTWYTIRYANRQRKPIWIIYQGGDVEALNVPEVNEPAWKTNKVLFDHLPDWRPRRVLRP